MSTESMNEASYARLTDLQIAEQLVEQAKADGVELVGPGGLLNGLTRTVLETALEVEMSEHLGYDKHDAVGRNLGNSAERQQVQDSPDGGRSRDDRGATRPGRHVRAEDSQEAFPADARSGRAGHLAVGEGTDHR